MSDKNSYNETILKMMMYYPGIFPSEFHCQEHLFLVIGNGYEWNKKGQLAEPEAIASLMGKLEIQRTRKSILSMGLGTEESDDIRQKFKNGDVVLFHPCGSIVFTPLYPWSKYSRLYHLLDGKILPALDWSAAIERFCIEITQWSYKDYARKIRAYYELLGFEPDDLDQQIIYFDKIKPNLLKVLSKIYLMRAKKQNAYHTKTR